MVRYDVVNMFTDRPFTGSALGVVPEAEGLSTEDMQAIAREINLVETAFVLPPSSAAASYRVRVFTPTKESPFGGHSSIGTATTLVRLRKIAAGQSVQECGARLLSLWAGELGATVTSAAPWDSREVNPSALLAACGLKDKDLCGTPSAVGFGPLFHFLPVRSDAVARARLNQEQMSMAGLPDVFVFSWDAQQSAAHARLFAPGYEIPEDPACVSAALAHSLWLFRAGWLPASDGVHRYRIHQGNELGRPATLDCAVTVQNGNATAASVHGRVVAAAHGHILVAHDPPAAQQEVAPRVEDGKVYHRFPGP